MTEITFTTHPTLNEPLTPHRRGYHPNIQAARTNEVVSIIRDIDWLAWMLEEHAPTAKYPKGYTVDELVQSLAECIAFRFDIEFLVRMVGMYAGIGALVDTHLRDVIMTAIIKCADQQGEQR